MVNRVYGLSIPGLVYSYTIAIPFFAYSVLSTLCFSVIIEIGYKILSNKYKFKKPRNRQKLIVNINNLRCLHISNQRSKNVKSDAGAIMGIHYDYKSTRGDKAMKKEAKRKARIEQKKS